MYGNFLYYCVYSFTLLLLLLLLFFCFPFFYFIFYPIKKIKKKNIIFTTNRRNKRATRICIWKGIQQTAKKKESKSIKHDSYFFGMLCLYWADVVFFWKLKEPWNMLKICSYRFGSETNSEICS